MHMKIPNFIILEEYMPSLECVKYVLRTTSNLSGITMIVFCHWVSQYQPNDFFSSKSGTTT